MLQTVMAMVLAAASPAASETGVLPGGARWAASMPTKWNGTLLLWSRGYSPAPGNPEAAPKAVADTLIAEGYALVGSDYGSGGWALEQAVPAQDATTAAFAARYGKPRRVIAWGYSMGGLVTTALVEQRRPKVNGGVAMCASIGGAVGMMNMALDGAMAFRTLVAPDAGIQLAGIGDDRENGRRVAGALAEALKTPEGRARVTLAGVLAGIPGWTSRDLPRPADSDFAAQAAEIAKSFVMGVFLPRNDQETRAGGNFSWTTGDYAGQLAKSGRRPLVAALYAAAGIDLDADLRRLDAEPRIAAEPAAVAYMKRNYTPDARPRVPLVAVQAIGDGLTSPSMQRGYAEAAKGEFKSLWVDQAGHCSFKPEQVVAAIRYMDARLATRRWPATPPMFIAHTPPPMLRPCIRGGVCR